jgi:hypothetical protein
MLLLIAKLLDSFVYITVKEKRVLKKLWETKKKFKKFVGNRNKIKKFVEFFIFFKKKND